MLPPPPPLTSSETGAATQSIKYTIQCLAQQRDQTTASPGGHIQCSAPAPWWYLAHTYAFVILGLHMSSATCPALTRHAHGATQRAVCRLFIAQTHRNTRARMRVTAPAVSQIHKPRAWRRTPHSQAHFCIDAAAVTHVPGVCPLNTEPPPTPPDRDGTSRY